MVPQQVSFVERSSLSQRVPYRRFHCITVGGYELKAILSVVKGSTKQFVFSRQLLMLCYIILIDTTSTYLTISTTLDKQAMYFFPHTLPPFSPPPPPPPPPPPLLFLTPPSPSLSPPLPPLLFLPLPLSPHPGKDLTAAKLEPVLKNELAYLTGELSCCSGHQ